MTTSNHCTIHKAIKHAPDTPTPNLLIAANEEIPEFTSLHESRSRFISEAESIFKALTASLPGGTLDHLLSIMLREKASHFIISSWNNDKG